MGKRLAHGVSSIQMQYPPHNLLTKKKTKVIHNYTLHGHILKEVSSAKYLGVTISDDMSWNRHIDSTTAKANSKLGFLKRNLKIKDTKLKEKAYKAIVRPSTQ